MTIEPSLPAEIVDFWRTAGPARWFAHDEAFDAELKMRFEGLHLAAARGELTAWTETAEGALALLILVDQVPRNLWRGSAHAYATDALARAVAEAALAAGHDRQVEPELRAFFYLPFEHHEDTTSQDRAVALFQALADETGDPGGLTWAQMHRDLIARFGRFPHRNASLGRVSTPEEARFLAEGGFAG